MYRGGNCSRRSHFVRTASPAFLGQNSFVGYQDTESKACKIIQAQKDKLLSSLALYFAKELDKNDLKKDLNQIKGTLLKDCPSYVPAPNSCC
jgi:hypothetical protein